MGTIKWGDPSNLEDYQGSRDFAALEKFAKENLKPMCSPSNIDLCEGDKKAQIEKFLGMAGDELDKMIAEKEKKEADIKESGLGLMKACKVHAAKKGSDEL